MYSVKQKGLNVDSAFNIFDIDRMNEISLDNFKNTLLFTLKFSTNQIEIEHLIKQLNLIDDKIDFIYSKAKNLSITIEEKN